MGITGKRNESDDHMLRQQLDPQHMLCNPDVRVS
jgi:hypothetical protein